MKQQQARVRVSRTRKMLILNVDLHVRPEVPHSAIFDTWFCFRLIFSMNLSAQYSNLNNFVSQILEHPV